MPPKTKTKAGPKAKSVKTKVTDELPPVKPEPPRIIVDEQLVHNNWWPVIGLVMESSPVESMLVDLMVDSIQGNSVFVIKKCDLIQEALTLLAAHRAPVSPDAHLTRRQKEWAIKQRMQDEQNGREKERDEREKEEKERQMAMEGKTAEKAPKNSNNIKSSKVSVATKAKKEDQAVTAAAAAAAATEAKPKDANYVDDLFAELQLHAKDTTIEDMIKNEDIRTLVILIKRKLMLLKKYDLDLYQTLKPKKESKQPEAPPLPVVSPVPVLTKDKVKAGKKEKQTKENGKVSVSKTNAKEGKEQALGGATKTQKATVAIGKGKIPPEVCFIDSWTGTYSIVLGNIRQLFCFQSAEETGIRDLGTQESYYHHLHLKSNDHKAESKTRARATNDVPEAIQDILKGVQDNQENEEDTSGFKLRRYTPQTGPNVVDESATKPTTNDQAAPKEPKIEANEMASLQRIFLASIFGTEGLPPLNHALSTQLALYGIPCVPTSKNQMVRYVILNGFYDASILTEMMRNKAAVTCVFKVELLRHRNLPPVKLSNLIWLTDPKGCSLKLQSFWAEVKKFAGLNQKEEGNQLCPLTLQVRFDVAEHTSAVQFQDIAKETGICLADLFYNVVFAKTLFQFYNSSLVLQDVGQAFRPKSRGKLTDYTEDVWDYSADLLKCCDDIVSPKSDPSANAQAISEDVNNLVSHVGLRAFQRNICKTFSRLSSGSQLDSRHQLQQTPQTARQTIVTFHHLGVLESSDTALGQDPAVENKSAFQTAMEAENFRCTYEKQHVEHLMNKLVKEIKKTAIRHAKQTVHRNPLAEAMNAWRSASHRPQRSVQDSHMEFVFEGNSCEIDKDMLPVQPNDQRLSDLATMSDYCAVATYPPKRLLTELANASSTYFYHCVKHDPECRKTFIIFYALHDRNTHRHRRRSEIRLDSKADFDTFVCNILENVQSWVDQNLHKLHRCPRRLEIAPDFPYGCRGQFACDPDTAEKLEIASQDQINDFVLNSSLKNFVRFNRDLFAKRCNWLNCRTAEERQCETKHFEQTSISTPPEPFIWNRSKTAVPPRCTMASSHPTVSAYSVSNSLSKIVREQEMIYGRDVVMCIEKTEAFNDATSISLVTSLTDGLDLYLIHGDDNVRSISLDIDGKTRMAIGFDIAGGVELHLRDADGHLVFFPNNVPVFCEIQSITNSKRSRRDFREWYGYSKRGNLYSVGKKPTVTSPFGNTWELPHPVENETVPNDADHTLGNPYDNTVVFFSGVMKRSGTRACFGKNGTEQAIVTVPTGTKRKLEVPADARFTSRMRIESDRDTAQDYTVIEKKDFPRVGLRRDMQFGYLSCRHGVFILKTENGRTFLIAGSNCVIILENGDLYAGKLQRVLKMFGLYGQPELQGFATSLMISEATFVLEFLSTTDDWQGSDCLIKFSHTSTALSTVYDYSLYRYDISNNGEACRTPETDDKDRCALPNPRVFTVDLASAKATELLHGEQAVALKYKTLSHYPTCGMRSGRHKDSFSCSVLEDSSVPWTYEYENVLPEAFLSNMKPYISNPEKVVFHNQPFRPTTLNFDKTRELWTDISFFRQTTERALFPGS